MARRSKAREVALQMLFQVDLNPDVDGRTVAQMMRERLGDSDVREFAWVLFAGVMEWRAQLDQRIQDVATNWKLSRMAATDRNVLRIGAFELLHTATPHRVVIDEALELAKKFGSEQSAQFVNGILDKLVPPERRENKASAADSDAD
ncbi:transcription antitermination factor NusB [Maioricimonas sp. JC845]|uniref:transcription antitermination factor NusB n=1 Tax=Maioricimonas sp. JC845 TaxID=3232138 RepID=UPI003458EB59